MGFSDSVHALLDTYEKCLDLLHSVSASATSGKHKGHMVADGDNRTVLSQSLLEDRAKVQQAYALRLREAGCRLEKGDQRSRSVLRRIVRRLAGALASLFGLGKSDSQLPLTYDALRALSNESRVGAIKTIDALSVRLNRSQSDRGTQSQRSSKTNNQSGVQSSSTRSPHSSSSSEAVLLRQPPAPAASGRHHRGGDQPIHGQKRKLQSSRPHRDTPATRGTHETREKSVTHERMAHVAQAHALPREPQGIKRSPTMPAPAQRRHVSHKSRAARVNAISSATTVSSLPGPSRHDHNRHHPSRRISQLSSSSASTKLGEIPENKLRHHPRNAAAGTVDQGQATSGAWDGGVREYNVRPTYPVRPFHVPPPVEEEGRKGFWGRFGKA